MSWKPQGFAGKEPTGAVVGEGDVGVPGEAEGLVLVPGEGLVEVLGVRLGDAPALSVGVLCGGISATSAWHSPAVALEPNQLLPMPPPNVRMGAL